MKILPSNQALILAGEPAGRRAGGDTFLEQASRLVTGSAELKRVTILSARPDSTMVVQADYFSASDGYQRDEVSTHDESSTIASQLPAIQHLPSNALAVSAASRMSTEPATASHILKPTQLYARTQRGLEDTRPSVLDVLA